MYDYALIEKSFKDEKTAIKTNKVEMVFVILCNVVY